MSDDIRLWRYQCGACGLHSEMIGNCVCGGRFDLIFKQATAKQAGGILDEAKAVIYGDRELTYGDPGVNVKRIAAFWSIVFGTQVSPDQVCLAMIALKVSRLLQTPGHHDSQVDLAGYAALMERIQKEAAKPIKEKA